MAPCAQSSSPPSAAAICIAVVSLSGGVIVLSASFAYQGPVGVLTLSDGGAAAASLAEASASSASEASGAAGRPAYTLRVELAGVGVALVDEVYYIYICIYICVYMCVCIYIERDRDRDREIYTYYALLVELAGVGVALVDKVCIRI